MGIYQFEIEGKPEQAFYCNACFIFDDSDAEHDPEVTFEAVTVESVATDDAIRSRDDGDAGFWKECDAIAAKYVDDNRERLAELVTERELCSVF